MCRWVRSTAAAGIERAIELPRTLRVRHHPVPRLALPLAAAVRVAAAQGTSAQRAGPQVIDGGQLPTTASERQSPPDILRNWLGIYTGSAFVSREENPYRLAGPIQFVLKLLDFWRIETHEAAGFLGFDSADVDHVVAVFEGKEQFRGRGARDRISHLIWTRKTLWSPFRDLESENAWLREPHSMLDNRKPLSLLLGGSMEDLLLTREYVESAAGR